MENKDRCGQHCSLLKFSNNVLFVLSKLLAAWEASYCGITHQHSSQGLLLLFNYWEIDVNYLVCVFFLQRWPVDHTLNVWMPACSLSAESAQGGSSSSHRNSEPAAESCDNHSHHGNMSVRPGFGLLSVAGCVGRETEGDGQSSLLSRVEGLPSWSVRKFQVVGFKLNLVQTASIDECLSLTLWPSALSKGSFIKHG